MTPDIFSYAQIVGYAAYAATIVAFWQKNDKKLLLINAASTIIWMWHFALMGTWAGVLTEGLVCVRSLLSAYMTNQKQRHSAAFLFVLAFFVAGMATCQVWYEWIVVAACIAGTIAMVYLTGFALRYGMLIALIFWFLFGYFIGSIGEMMSGLTLMIVQLVTLLRMYRDKRMVAIAA